MKLPRIAMLALLMLFAMPAKAGAQSLSGFKSQFIPWTETNLSAKADPEIDLTVGGTLRFETSLKFSEKTDLTRARVRLDLAILRAPGADVLDPADQTTWGKHASAALTFITQPRFFDGGNLAFYSRYEFRTTVDGEKILDRFDRDYEVGFFVGGEKGELQLGSGRFQQLVNRWGWVIRGRAPVPHLDDIVWIDGSAILGIGPKSGGIDSYTLRVGIDPSAVVKALKK